MKLIDNKEPEAVGALLIENAILKAAIRRFIDKDATLSVCDGNVTVTVDATLTDGERRAMEFAIAAYPLDDSIPATLRGLLERTK